ncbi:MAG: hypothetical protein OXF11_07370 [Deltaproteobacteria bacterium]|nr:hypothetical protein [Deltaproteobacteria bacterium]
MAQAGKDIEARLNKIRGSADFNVIGDNIADIAEYTVEKYEYRNDTSLARETREQALAEITDVLCDRVERLKARRQEILADMFNAAEATLNEVVSQSK